MSRRIYLASSWRNPLQPQAVALLSEAGHAVYDFRNPTPGNTGFAWAEIDPEWRDWTPTRFVDALASPVAQHGYSFDKAALDWCDTCVLLLPCARSAHLEAGYAIGQGKPTLIVLHEQNFEPELMYLLADAIAPGLEHMVAALDGMRHSPRHAPMFITYPDKDLEYDEGGEGLWGCNCGSGVFGRTYYTNEDNTQWRVECGCGLCGPWGDSVQEACFHWNLIVASLTGPYSMMELFYRRLVRIAKKNGKDSGPAERMLQDHVRGYETNNYQ